MVRGREMAGGQRQVTWLVVRGREMASSQR